MSSFSVQPQFQYSVVDVSDNSTTVFAGPCILRSVIVHTALSAHAMPIQDDTTVIASLAASSAIGTVLECGDVKLLTSLVVNPDDSGTGMVTVVFAPTHDGLAGSGYSV